MSHIYNKSIIFLYVVLLISFHNFVFAAEGTLPPTEATASSADDRMDTTGAVTVKPVSASSFECDGDSDEDSDGDDSRPRKKQCSRAESSFMPLCTPVKSSSKSPSKSPFRPLGDSASICYRKASPPSSDYDGPATERAEGSDVDDAETSAAESRQLETRTAEIIRGLTNRIGALSAEEQLLFEGFDGVNPHWNGK